MANLSEWRIYLSHDRMILTNDHGFRAEFAVPIPGNIIVITLGRESYHFGFFPQNPQRRLLPATTTIAVRHPPNQALTPKIPFNCNCPQAQYVIFVYISCVISRFDQPSTTGKLQRFYQVSEIFVNNYAVIKL